MRTPLFRGLIFVLAGLIPNLCGSDTVVLKNSDRLTGELQKLEKDRLSLKTDYAGIVRIDWSKVQGISTDRKFEVEVETGLRLTGTLHAAGPTVEIAAEERTFRLARSAIVSMEPASEEGPAGFLKRLQGHVDLGYSLTRGNSQLNQSSLGVETVYRTPAYQVQTQLNSLFSGQSDAPTTSTHKASLRYDRFLSSRVFAFGLTGLERDDRQLLNLRTSLGGGLGWKLIKSDRTSLSFLTGSTYVNEQFREDPSNSNNDGSSGEALVGLTLEKATLGRIIFTSDLSAFRNFLGLGRYRMTFDGGMRIPLVSSFTWSLRLFDRFDSRPPRRVKRNDYGIVSSIGVVF